MKPVPFNWLDYMQYLKENKQAAAEGGTKYKSKIYKKFPGERGVYSCNYPFE
jgi:hypothetical protein